MKPEPFTISRIIHVVWWKRPWYWLLRKPTRRIDVFENCTFTNLAVSRNADDGTLYISYDLVAHPEISQIHMSDELRIPESDG